MAAVRRRAPTRERRQRFLLAVLADGAPARWSRGIWLPGDVIHTVTFDADTTIMSAFQSSGTYARTFTVAGTYPYHCSIHGKAMTGVITVQ